MNLLKSDEVKLRILETIKDGKWYSFYSIQRKCNVNYSMLKKHITFLEILGLVEVVKISPEESSTGKGSYRVRITQEGKKITLAKSSIGAQI